MPFPFYFDMCILNQNVDIKIKKESDFMKILWKNKNKPWNWLMIRRTKFEINSSHEMPNEKQRTSR